MDHAFWHERWNSNRIGFHESEPHPADSPYYGVVLTGVAAAALDPLELAGIRQAFGQPQAAGTELSTTGVYRVVRVY